MDKPIILWSKPSCVQCNMVKVFIIKELTGQSGLNAELRDQAWHELIGAGKVVEYDLTADTAHADLEYFKKLGYMAAPITEYGGSLTAGFIPAQLSTITETWKHDHPDAARV